jgi:hypothetical protein
MFALRGEPLRCIRPLTNMTFSESAAEQPGKAWPVPVYILGINAYHGDVSAVLLRDGELVAAVSGATHTRSPNPPRPVHNVLLQGIH